jgi:uncharacterized protein with PQ loop repeat
MSTLAVFAVALGVLDSARFWPQTARVHRMQISDGLSFLAVSVGVNGCVMWLIYAVRSDLLSLVPSTASTLGASALLALLLVRLQRLSVGRWASGIGLVLAGGTAAYLLPLPVLGAVLVVEGVASHLPYLFAAFRSSHPDAVSLTGWSLTLLSAALWAVMGVVLEDLPTLVWAASALLSAVLILLRCLPLRRAARAAAN